MPAQTYTRPDSPARLIRDGDGLILEHPMLGGVERQVLGVTHVSDDVLLAGGWIPDNDLTRPASGMANAVKNAPNGETAILGRRRNADSVYEEAYNVE